MNGKMTAAVLYGKEDIKIERVPIPRVGDGEVLKERLGEGCGAAEARADVGEVCAGDDDAVALFAGEHVAQGLDDLGDPRKLHRRNVLLHRAVEAAAEDGDDLEVPLSLPADVLEEDELELDGMFGAVCELVAEEVASGAAEKLVDEAGVGDGVAERGLEVFSGECEALGGVVVGGAEDDEEVGAAGTGERVKGVGVGFSSAGIVDVRGDESAEAGGRGWQSRGS